MRPSSPPRRCRVGLLQRLPRGPLGTDQCWWPLRVNLWQAVSQLIFMQPWYEFGNSSDENRPGHRRTVMIGLVSQAVASHDQLDQLALPVP